MGTAVTRFALLAAVASCAARPPVVVMISANAEWRALGFPGDRLERELGGRRVVFFHGGYGKVAAAASTQYAIDHWHPALVVNLGTCGGFGGGHRVGDVVLASATIIYDLIEQMGDPDEPIRDYTTKLDTSRWPARLRARVAIEPLVSADRDLLASEVAQLHAKYGASAGDWESGAIAWTAAKNHVPVMILRAVTDVVDAHGDATYGDPAAWQRETAKQMATLVALLSEALADL